MATAVSEIIRLAFREANFKSIIDNPTAEEQAEAMTLLQGIVDSVFPLLVGTRLTPVRVAHSTDVGGNTRMIFSNAASIHVSLPAEPQDGTVVAYVDAGHAGDVILDAGRNFVGQTGVDRKVTISPTYPESRMKGRVWFYRDDITSWVELAPLQAALPLPFPYDFLDFFVTALSIRLSPRFGAEPRQITMVRMAQMEDYIRLLYRQTRDVGIVNPTGVPSRQSFDVTEGYGEGWM